MTLADAAEPDRAQGPRVLVSAASTHGSTSEIAQVIGQVLATQGLTVTVLPPAEVQSIDEYDAIIIGSAVYSSHWLDAATDLVNLFSSGAVGSPVSKLSLAMAREPVEIAGLRIATHAREHRMFAGKLDRKVLTHAQWASLLIFHGLEGDFRNWAEIRHWATGIAQQLVPAPA